MHRLPARISCDLPRRWKISKVRINTVKNVLKTLKEEFDGYSRGAKDRLKRFRTTFKIKIDRFFDYLISATFQDFLRRKELQQLYHLELPSGRQCNIAAVPDGSLKRYQTGFHVIGLIGWHCRLRQSDDSSQFSYIVCFSCSCTIRRDGWDWPEFEKSGSFFS